MLLALFAVHSVNLSEIAVAFFSKADKESRYKRLQRFFGKFKIDYSAKKIFNDLPLKTQKWFGMTVDVFGQRLFLAGSRSEKGALMIVATNENPRNAISIYLRRWEIECLFAALKGRGFRFEETHMISLERIEKLTALLAIAFEDYPQQELIS